MTDTEDKNNQTQPPTEKTPLDPTEDQSLAEIDKLLSEDDPEFSKSLAEITEAGENIDANVNIESLNINEDDIDSSEVPFSESKSSLFSRLPGLKKLETPWSRLRLKLFPFWLKFKNRVFTNGKRLIFFLINQPKECWSYIGSLTKALTGFVALQIKSFKALSWQNKFLIVIFFSSLFLILFFLRLNLTGTWLPQLQRPLLSSYTSLADQTFLIKANELYVPLYEALPYPRHEYLFDKIVVNLRRRPGLNENPMGYFEFIVGVDSNETAIEVKAREREFLDHLQRTVESYSYSELSDPNGLERMKHSVRQELNAHLRQGWVRDVWLQNIILKP